MSTTKTRRSLSLLAAFAVAAGALALPAAASQATPTFGLAATTERAPSLVDLDAAKTGSITIHKLVKQDDNGTKEGNGLVDPSATGAPLAGATFTVEKLTSVDLTKQEGWEKLANLCVLDDQGGLAGAADQEALGGGSLGDDQRAGRSSHDSQGGQGAGCDSCSLGPRVARARSTCCHRSFSLTFLRCVVTGGTSGSVFPQP